MNRFFLAISCLLFLWGGIGFASPSRENADSGQPAVSGGGAESSEGTAEDYAETSAVGKRTHKAGNDATTLRLGLMPAINSIPIIIAEEAGLFREEGLSVTLVMFQSQFYRESALQSNQIDGSVSDLINAINAWHNGFQVKVTSLTQGDFALMTSAKSGIRNMRDWNAHTGSVKTGLLKDSIVYFETEKMLDAGGGDKAKVDLVSTLHLPSRLEMLLAGELDAGCFPEPVATIAEMQGAFRLADTAAFSSTPGVFLFTDKALREKAGAIAAFYRAYDKAADLLNERGDDYRNVIAEKGNFPPAVADVFPLPVFHKARNFTAAEFANVAEWMAKKKLIERLPSYAEVMDTAFVR